MKMIVDIHQIRLVILKKIEELDESHESPDPTLVLKIKLKQKFIKNR
jgi:hypothetical protein